MDTIAQVLEAMTAALSGCWLKDGPLRQRALQARGDQSGELAILSAVPETDDEAQAVDDWVRRWFGLGLPVDYAAFAACFNGLTLVREASRDEAPSVEEGSFTANALLPLSELDCLWSMRTIAHAVEGSEATSIEHRHPKVIPFYAHSETRFHAFDYGRVDQDGNVPVVAVDASKEPLSVGQGVLAGSFTDWIRDWIEGGFAPRG